MSELEPRKIADPVYGEAVITEPVLLELIDSPTVQRLKRISQLGQPKGFYHLKGFSRFDHSIGVMTLLRKLGAEVDEQVAGLLHDASHTAFSHMIDWVMGSQSTADYQDSVHEDFLNRSEISNILIKYSLNLGEITDYHNFSLLEQEMPLLCADRVDYGLREMLISGFSPESVPGCVNSLTTSQGRIVFSNLEAARKFGLGFLSLQNGDWGSIETMTRNALFSDILKQALEKDVITMDDFYQDDEYVMEKLLGCNDFSLISALGNLRKPFNQIPEVEHVKGRVIHHKFRYVDPEVLIDGRSVRLMDEDPEYKIQVFTHKEISNAGVVL